MADELIHSGTWGENWWSNGTMFGSSSLCASSSISDVGGENEWSNINFFEGMKPRSTDESLFLHQDVHNVNESLDSTTTSELNEAFLQTNGSSNQSSYSITYQEDYNLSMNNYHHHEQQSVMDFCPKSYVSDQESSNSTTFTSSALNQNYGLEQPQMSSDFTSTCDVLPSNYQLNPPSSCGYSSAFLQNLFADHQSTNFPSSTATTDNSFQTKNMHGFSLTKQPSLAFANNTSSWDSTATALNDIKAVVLLPPTSPSVGEKFNRPKASTAKARIEEVKKTNDEPSSKRPRMETPSPLPTFKVRKEKLGDRITALQQLVSPFGKTDTASVLHEAIEYIKFLHDQVDVLSTPYTKNGCPSQRQQGKKEQEQDLKSRGLCLVPLSSTFSLATEPPTDFWTPTLGGAFRNDKWEAWNGGSHIALACKF